MNLGAKAWMVWLQDLLNTISKVLALQSGKPFFFLGYEFVTCRFDWNLFGWLNCLHMMGK